jgi:hypothetical protein
VADLILTPRRRRVKQEGAREAMMGLWGEFMSANGTKFANGSAHAG